MVDLCGQVFPDGRTVVRFGNGDVKKTNPHEGTVVYYYAEARTTQTSYYKSGLEVFEFPNGQVGGGATRGMVIEPQRWTSWWACLLWAVGCGGMGWSGGEALQ